MSKRKISVFALSVLTALTLAFIWGNSFMSRSGSAEISLGVLEYVKPVLEAVIGRGNVTNHLVRKIAHFCEFGLLGTELICLWWLLKRRITVSNTVYAAFSALVCAMTDETIQIFTSRGSAVADVWLDFGGAVCAIAIVVLVYILIKKKEGD